MFLDWVQLKSLLEYRLDALLGRDIKPLAFKDGDYWDVQTEKYSEEELELLFSIADAATCLAMKYREEIAEQIESWDTPKQSSGRQSTI